MLISLEFNLIHNINSLPDDSISIISISGQGPGFYFVKSISYDMMSLENKI